MVDYTLTLIETAEKGIEGINFSCTDVDFSARVIDTVRKYLPTHKIVQLVDEEQLHTGINVIFDKDKKGKIGKKSTGFFMKAIKEVLDGDTVPEASEVSDEV